MESIQKHMESIAFADKILDIQNTLLTENFNDTDLQYFITVWQIQTIQFNQISIQTYPCLWYFI